MSKETDKICDEIGALLGSEVREMAGYSCLGVVGQQKVAQKLKALVAMLKADILQALMLDDGK